MANPIDSLLETPDVLTQLAVQYGPRVLTATLVLVAGLFVMHWVAKFAARGLSRLSLEQPVRDLLLRVVRIVVLFLFLLLALQNLGIDLLPLLAGLGIAGAGIALALQGVLGNVAAGLTIIFTRPFRVGEYISIAGEEGIVSQDLDLQHDAAPQRPLAGRGPQPQDRRRDPAQLRRDPAAGPHRQRRLRHRPRSRRRRGPGRARVQCARAAGSGAARCRRRARRLRDLDRDQAVGRRAGLRRRRRRDQSSRRRRFRQHGVQIPVLRLTVSA